MEVYLLAIKTFAPAAGVGAVAFLILHLYVTIMERIIRKRILENELDSLTLVAVQEKDAEIERLRRELKECSHERRKLQDIMSVISRAIQG